MNLDFLEKQLLKKAFFQKKLGEKTCFWKSFEKKVILPKELIKKYFDIAAHRTDNTKDVMKNILETSS